MKNIIFDIDGTLTNTTDIDDRCFTQALEETFDFRDIDTNWGNYEHTTDSGIIQQLFLERKQRTCGAEETSRFIEHFCGLLKAEYARQTDSIQEVPKAGKILHTLCERADVKVGLATGGWRESALFKLSCAGINIEACSAASFAQDAVARRDIIHSTITRMNTRYQQKAPLSSIIYVGDGLWDYRATQQLGIQFIGIDNKKLSHLHDIVKISDYDELQDHLVQYGS
jgi:phosphoglycolate phosphatase-like HAD superfamily hydrolase